MDFHYYTKKETGYSYNLWMVQTDSYVTIAKFDNNQYLVTNEARGCEEMFDNLKDAKSKAEYEAKRNETI